MTRASRVRRAGVMVMIAAGACGIQGCADRPGSAGPGGDVAVSSKPAPAYAEVAAAYNRRASRLEKLRALAIVRLTYADEKGDRHTDQGEGVLQMVRPDRVALSIKKAGKTLFWLGCDGERYWFFDLVDEKIARVGRNPRASEIGRDASGIGIPPRELFELIGMVELDPEAAGKVEWTTDDRLRVTIPKAGAGEVIAGETILVLDAKSFEPVRVERRDGKGNVIISAALSGYEGVEIEGEGGLKPRLATKMDAVHVPSDTRIRLDLSEMRDSGIVPSAFVFETLRASLGVSKVIEVSEEEGKAPGDAGAPEGKTGAGGAAPTPAPNQAARGTPIAPRKPAGKP
ncbi:MAG: hypothetical protein AB7G11_10465 [Phycisphaerales bacterium]